MRIISCLFIYITNLSRRLVYVYNFLHFEEIIFNSQSDCFFQSEGESDCLEFPASSCLRILFLKAAGLFLFVVAASSLFCLTGWRNWFVFWVAFPAWPVFSVSPPAINILLVCMLLASFFLHSKTPIFAFVSQVFSELFIAHI